MHEFTTNEAHAAYRRESLGVFKRYRFQDLKYLAELTNDTLWMSDPTNFNDPFDLKPVINNEFDSGPFSNSKLLKKAFSCLFKKNPEIENNWFYDEKLINELTLWIDGAIDDNQLIKSVQNRSTSFGVACFAPDWAMPLMWSHYGNKHNGMCIAYEVDQINFPREEKNLKFSDHYVQYVTALPTICLSEVLFSPHKVFPRILSTKHSDWAYEREWRLIDFTTKATAVPIPKHMRMTALIAGLGCTHNDTQAIGKKAADLGVAAYKVIQYAGHDLILKRI